MPKAIWTAALAGAALLAAAALAAPRAEAATDWPNKPVRLIANYPAGGSVDLLARPYADALSRKLGQPFVVENRAGAAGAVGTEVVARAEPDGYTLLASPNGPMVLLPVLRKLNYDPKDLVPVGPMGEFVYGVGVLPDRGIKSMDELIARAKAEPGKLSYASPGAGSATNLRGEVIKLIAGVDILHVPYRTGAESVIDFMAGTVDVIIDSIIFPQVRQKKVVLLAVTSERRYPDFPDVPTLAEAGFKMNLASFLSIYVPKGTPEDVYGKLAGAITEINADPEMQRKILNVGFFPMQKTGQQLRSELDASIESYASWVKKTGLKIE